MSKSFRRFFLNHTLLTVFLAVIFLSVKILFPTFPIPGSIVTIFIFFYVFVLVVHWILIRSSEHRPQVFIRTFLVMTIAKLFVYIGFISLLIVWDKSDTKGVIIVFSVLYLVHLIHEIAAILKHLSTRENTEKSQQK